MNEERLGQAGNPHEQSMAAGENADQQFLNDGVLPNNDFAEFRADFGKKHAQFVDGRDISFGFGGGQGGEFRHHGRDGSVTWQGREGKAR